MAGPTEIPQRWELSLDRTTARKGREDRGYVHRLLMSMLPDGVFDSSRPRADARLLWAWTGPATLIVASDIPLAQARGVEMKPAAAVEPLTAGQELALTVLLETTFTKAAWVPEEIWNLPDRPAIRNKRIPVPDDRLDAWIREKLERNGLAAKNVSVLATSREKVKKHTIPTAAVAATVTVVDPKKANEALVGGLGRSKNFGCGMLLPLN